jgi:hypothetical protein
MTSNIGMYNELNDTVTTRCFTAEKEEQEGEEEEEEGENSGMCVCFHRGPVMGNMDGHSFPRAFERMKTFLYLGQFLFGI